MVRDTRKLKSKIVRDWLPRYTGMELSEFGEYILLTNFSDYVRMFAERFDVEVRGKGYPMQSCSNGKGLTIINFGIGSANVATIMDLLVATKPKGVLFLGKCGGLKKSTDIGKFILPIAAIRGEGTSNDYALPEMPALPSFKLHKFVSQILVDKEIDYRTGVVYTTNRRVWEHDEEFKQHLQKLRTIAIDMETATLFTVGLINDIPRGALLLISDMPMLPEGIKTTASDRLVNEQYTSLHLDMGIEAMQEIDEHGEKIKHYSF
ncbi:MAG: AMP nucleosidase [Pseudomonadota bacterium]|nr:AMP nucleosidase [Pseudomonadota bacterium]